MSTRRTPAKITAPRIAQVASRLHLWSRFDSAPLPGAIWLHAPAGCGKTMAVAGWLHEHGCRAVWYRIDEGDADPATLFDYLRRSLPAESAAALPAFTGEFRMGLAAFARRWFERWWAEQLAADAQAPVLVLDDYQEAGADGLHHEVIRLAIEQAPEQARLFICSRQEPPAAWARLIGSGQLTVVRAADIALGDDEALALARQRRPQAGDSQLRRAVRACGGWAAGLVLLLQSDAQDGSAGDSPPGQSIQDAIDPNELLDPQDRQRVFDYFAHEVVSHLPPATRQVLQAAAWLTVAWVDVVAQATGLHQAGDVLEDLHRRGLFTLQVDRRGGGLRAFQFHPLFQAHLRSPAVQGTDEGSIRARQSALADSLVQHALLEDAVWLYLAAGQPDTALALVRQLSETMVRQGRHQRLLQLLGDVPESALLQDPWALLARGQARALLAQSGAEPDLRMAMERFALLDDHDGLTATLSVMLVTLTSRPTSNPGDMRPLFDRLAELDSQWRGSAAMRYTLLRTLLGARWFSDPADSRVDGWLAELRSIADAAGTPEALGSWLHPELLYAVVRGDHSRVRSALLVLDRIEPDLLVADLQAMFRFLRVYALNRIGEHAQAAQAFQAAAAGAQSEGAMIWAYQISMHGVEALLGAGHLVQAQQLLENLQRQLPVEQGFAAIFSCLLSGWISMARGEFDDALVQVQLMRKRLLKADVALFHTLAPLTLGWVQAARRQPEEAGVAFGEALLQARTLGSPLLCFDAMLGLSEARWQQGLRQESLQLLAQALAIGREPRYATVYYIQPADFSSLLDRALQAGIERDYVMSIIRRRQLPPPASRSVDWTWPVRVRCLGGLEIERESDGMRQPLRFAAKTPKKLLQLLKALVAFGGEHVSEGLLFDAVWPELEADQAAAALKVAMVRLNALLGEPGGWVWQRGGLVSLDAQRIWLDTWCLDRLLDDIDEASTLGVLDARHEPTTTDDRETVRRQIAAVMRLYRGSFLPSDLQETWTASPRERWRQRVVRVLLGCSARCRDRGDPEAALQACLAGFELDPLAEPLAVQAMELQQAQGRRLEALAVYERLKEALGRELGLRPSARAMALQRELISG